MAGIHEDWEERLQAGEIRQDEQKRARQNFLRAYRKRQKTSAKLEELKAKERDLTERLREATRGRPFMSPSGAVMAFWSKKGTYHLVRHPTAKPKVALPPSLANELGEHLKRRERLEKDHDLDRAMEYEQGQRVVELHGNVAVPIGGELFDPCENRGTVFLIARREGSEVELEA